MFNGNPNDSLIQLPYCMQLSLIATLPVHNYSGYGSDYHHQYCQYPYDY